MIPFNRPSILGAELRYIEEALRSGHISGDGQFTKKAHARLEQSVGTRKALLTTSCTHALEMTALLLDIKPGDEVIVPAFTFVSTVNAYVLRGAKPVFADIRPDTLNIDEKKLEALITPKTRAIVVVHYAGVGCEMDEIMAIAARHGNIPVIEDNAHALFAEYKGKQLGTFGRLSTLSFHETKNFSCGEGGALLVNDESLIERAEIIREKGTNRSRFFRGQVDKYSWVDVGSSYLPSDILAAVLLAQLDMSEQIQRTRQRIWNTYNRSLGDWARENRVTLPHVPAHCTQSYHMFYMLLPTLEDRTKFIAHLRERGVHSVFHYLPLNLSEMGLKFGGKPGQCPVTEDVSDRLVRLPFFNSLTDEQQAEVIEAVRSFHVAPAAKVSAKQAKRKHEAAAPVVATAPVPEPPAVVPVDDVEPVTTEAPRVTADVVRERALGVLTGAGQVIRKHAIDIVIGTLFFIAASLFASKHISNWSGPAEFYQGYFGAAVSAGCGRGFNNPGGDPRINAFLATTAQSVPCSAVRHAVIEPPTAFQSMHRYLMGSAGLIWRIRGAVTWQGLVPLFAILFGSTVVLGYAIGRLALGRVLAAAVALALMFSGNNLGILPLLRDYSKAPFFLGTVLLLALLVRQLRPTRQTLMLAGILGAVVGVGFGFRTDLLAAVPGVIVCLAAFLPGPLKSSWRLRLAAVGVFFAAFLITAAPVLRGISEHGGGSTAHVSLLGFASPFDDALGLETPYYQWSYDYSDTHIATLLDMYSNWTKGNTEPLVNDTPRYEVFGREYLRLIVRHFPADLLARGYASVLRVLELPVNGMVNHRYLDPNEQPIGIENPQMLARYERAYGGLVAVVGSGTILMAIAALLLLAARSLRIALFAAFVVLYFGAYTLLQFSLRHTFHLEIFGLWLTAFVIQAIVIGVVRWRRGRDPVEGFSDWKGAAAFGAILALSLPIALWILRAYQDGHVRTMVDRYVHAEKEAVTYTTGPGTAPGRVMLRPINAGEAAVKPGSFRFDYLLLELTDDHPVGPIIFWTKPIVREVWSQTSTLPLQMPPRFNTASTDITRIFFPVYSGPEVTFQGIELPETMIPSVKGVWRLKPSADLPMPLWLTLRPGWETLPPHERFWGPEMRRTLLAFPDTEKEVLSASIDTDVTTDLASAGTATTVEDGRIRVSGAIDLSNSDFFHFRTHDAKRGDTFVMEGTNRYGKFDVIAISRGYFVPVTVKQPGPFRVVIQMPADGSYMMIAAASVGKTGPMDLTVSRAGWITK